MVSGKRLLVLGLIAWTLALSAAGRAVGVVAELSANRIGLDDQVTLTIRVSGSSSAQPPQLPPLEGLDVFSSGQVFSSTVINGRLTSSVEFNYVLAPRRMGVFTLGPIPVKVDGREYRTAALRLEVGGSTAPTQPQPGGSATAAQGSTGNKDYLVEASVDKDTVYEGEQVKLTFRAYQRNGASFFSDPVYLPPSYSGFWHEELGWKRYSTAMRGDLYVVSELTTALFPVSPGRVTVDPSRVVVTVDEFANAFRSDPFNLHGLPSTRFRTTRPETLSTKPLLISVRPLPQVSRPRDFKGGVGSFKMTTKLSNPEISLDETVMLTVKINGKGNVKTVSAPDLPDIDGLDFRPSGDTSVIEEGAGTLVGSKTFEYTLIPDHEGVYELPPLTWSYFDPQEKSYKTLRSEASKITVNPGKTGGGEPMAGIATIPSDLRVRDILSVMPLGSGGSAGGRPMVFSPVFWIVQLLPIVFLLGAVVARRRHEKLTGDIGYRRHRQAHALARKRLTTADRFLRTGRADAYYAEISRALYEYVADKFNYSAGGLTESKVQELLVDRGYSLALGERFAELIGAADFGRFAPSQSDTEYGSKLLEQAEEWIVSAEEEGKRSR